MECCYLLILEDFLEEHHRVLESRLSSVSREITDNRARAREELESLYRKIVSYVLLRSGLGSPTDIKIVREATGKKGNDFHSISENIRSSYFINYVKTEVPFLSGKESPTNMLKFTQASFKWYINSKPQIEPVENEKIVYLLRAIHMLAPITSYQRNTGNNIKGTGTFGKPDFLSVEGAESAAPDDDEGHCVILGKC